MTDSQSSSVILWKITSRRMPALFTTASMRPKWSSAACTIFCAEAQAATDSVQISATPPFCLISRLGLLRRRGGAALAGQRGADVGNDDLGPGGGHHDGDLPADAAARAGDHRNLAFHHACHHTLLCS